MEIPYEMLNPETLAAIAREFVLREGTDYGHRDWAIDEKVSQVLGSVKAGRAKIVFDPKSETCSILRAEDVTALTASEKQSDQTEPHSQLEC